MGLGGIDFNWKMDVPFMAERERVELRALQKADKVSFFRLVQCQHKDEDGKQCEEFIPKGKLYCTKEHWAEMEGPEETEEDE